jgi:FkbM family methyltransferase
MTVSEKIFETLYFNDGFFIECGANDGITQSNTYLLEKLKNWNGILVEPSKNKFVECQTNRSTKNIFYNCALVSNDFKEEFIEGDFDGNLMSSINGRRLNRKNLELVPTLTLNYILEKHKIEKIDFFSLDVEGYELEVLKGIDFKKFKPSYILIEIYNHLFEPITNFLKNENYILVQNVSNFNKIDYPNWDGSHNDYLFKQIN